MGTGGRLPRRYPDQCCAPGQGRSPPHVGMGPERLSYNDEGSLNLHYRRVVTLAEEKLYQARYMGSGTFIISKPKRRKRKLRQTKLKNPRPGMRK